MTRRPDDWHVFIVRPVDHPDDDLDAYAPCACVRERAS